MKIRFQMTILVTACFCVLLISCGKLAVPVKVKDPSQEAFILEGKAFLVMKSLVVRKLADLTVYLLADPYPAIDEVKKSYIEQYNQASRKGLFDPSWEPTKKQIAEIQTQLGDLDVEQHQEIENQKRAIEEDLCRLTGGFTLESLKQQYESTTNELEASQRRLETLQHSRAAVETRYVKLIRIKEMEQVAGDRALEDYTASAPYPGDPSRDAEGNPKAVKSATLKAAADKTTLEFEALQKERRLMLDKFDLENGGKVQGEETRIQWLRADRVNLANYLSLIEGDQGNQATLPSRIEKTFQERRERLADQLVQSDYNLQSSISEYRNRLWNFCAVEMRKKIAEVIADKTVDTVQADGDGKFIFKLPSAGTFVIYARTKTASDEPVLWFKTIKVAGSGKTTVEQLSNSTARPVYELAKLNYTEQAYYEETDFVGWALSLE